VGVSHDFVFRNDSSVGDIIGRSPPVDYIIFDFFNGSSNPITALRAFFPRSLSGLLHFLGPSMFIDHHDGQTRIHGHIGRCIIC
jgi:hypothetical protein